MQWCCVCECAHGSLGNAVRSCVCCMFSNRQYFADAHYGSKAYATINLLVLVVLLILRLLLPLLILCSAYFIWWVLAPTRTVGIVCAFLMLHCSGYSMPSFLTVQWDNQPFDDGCEMCYVGALAPIIHFAVLQYGRLVQASWLSLQSCSSCGGIDSLIRFA